MDIWKAGAKLKLPPAQICRILAICRDKCVGGGVGGSACFSSTWKDSGPNLGEPGKHVFVYLRSSLLSELPQVEQLLSSTGANTKWVIVICSQLLPVQTWWAKPYLSSLWVRSEIRPGLCQAQCWVNRSRQRTIHSLVYTSLQSKVTN